MRSTLLSITPGAEEPHAASAMRLASYANYMARAFSAVVSIGADSEKFELMNELRGIFRDPVASLEALPSRLDSLRGVYPAKGEINSYIPRIKAIFSAHLALINNPLPLT